jgi:hypothetical protein
MALSRRQGGGQREVKPRGSKLCRCRIAGGVKRYAIGDRPQRCTLQPSMSAIEAALGCPAVGSMSLRVRSEPGDIARPILQTCRQR